MSFIQIYYYLAHTKDLGQDTEAHGSEALTIYLVDMQNVFNHLFIEQAIAIGIETQYWFILYSYICSYSFFLLYKYIFLLFY